MIEVELPDGTIVEFPAGTSAAVMEQALASYANPQAVPKTNSLGQTVKEFFLGDDDPNTQNMGEKIGTFLNKGGESMTFGLVGDEASAAVEGMLPGVDYADRRDHYRKQEELLEGSNPGASLVADIGGALAAPVGALGALGKGAGLIPRILASSGAAGAMSGLYGFTEGEGGFESRFDDAKLQGGLGALIGGAIPIVGSGVQKVLNTRAGSKAIKAAAANAPTTEQLRAAGSRAYQAVDDLGVQIKPEAFNRLTGDMGSTLQRGGLDQLPGPSSLTPKSARLMQITDEMGGAMAKEPTAALPFSSLDQLRRKAGVAAADVGNKLEASLGTQAIGSIDDFVTKLSPDDVAAGDAAALGPAIKTARDIWAKMSRSQTIDDAISASENYVSGSASGIRNQFSRILKSDKLSRGFSEAEKKMMRGVVNGSIPEKLIHLAGGGLGQLFSTATGAATGGLLGAAGGMGLGALARRTSEGITERGAETVRAVIANGGMAALPQASTRPAGLIEQLLRQGTAAALQ